jgi:hypothetical protein
VDTIKVFNGSHQLQFPFCGGLNNPQFSSFNLNQDTFPDLFVFDKSGNKVFAFINKGIHDSVAYKYFPSAENYFPNNLQGWALMRDMNCDGETDLISTNGPFLEIYFAHRNADQTISYQLKKFYQHGVGYVPFATYYIPGGTSGNIYETPTDIPIVADIDNDGDVDFLTFDQTSMIWCYKNRQAEDGMLCTDSIRLKNTEWCWGHLEDNSIRAVTLNINCTEPTQRHGNAKHLGNTMCTIDVDNDGDQDLVKGNISFSNLSLLINGKINGVDSFISQDTLFPNYDVPYNKATFAAPFAVDINNDKQPDILAAPNAQYISENRKCVSYYKNFGAGNAHQFRLQTDSFLVSEMIDVGEGNFPTFFDYNNDSLPDLVMGSNGAFDSLTRSFVARLYLYKNTGTKNHAEFHLISDDWLNLSAWHKRMLAPCFGDIDGDNLPDLFLGTDSGKIIFMKNMGWSTLPQFSLQSFNYQNLSVGSSCTPQLIDLNNDNLLDLVCGKLDGKLTYFENTGTATNPIFTKQTDSLGKVDVRENADLYGYSAPCFMRFTKSSPLSLLVGNKYGHVFQYENSSGNLTGAFHLQSNMFSNINCGERAAPTAAQLLGNDSIEILCGAYRGGVQLYTNSSSSNSNGISTIKNNYEQLLLYPNPCEDKLSVSGFQFSENTKVEIENILGQVILSLSNYPTSDNYQLNTSNLPVGIYFIKVVDAAGFQHTAKFVKQ